jgi:hypothetical protein
LTCCPIDTCGVNESRWRSFFPLGPDAICITLVTCASHALVSVVVSVLLCDILCHNIMSCIGNKGMMVSRSKMVFLLLLLSCKAEDIVLPSPSFVPYDYL